jgi:hypothetical protein
MLIFGMTPALGVMNLQKIGNTQKAYKSHGIKF